MWQDTIVAEIRAVRQAHAEKCAFDLRAMDADLKQEERKSRRKVVSFPAKPALSVDIFGEPHPHGDSEQCIPKSSQMSSA
jgi:hypothetical protein